jgi:two-component system response regulator
MINPYEVEILLVEDNSNDIELTLRAFKKHNITNKVQVVRDGAEALDFIFAKGIYAERGINNIPRVILLDLKLPKVDGIEVLRRVKSDERTKIIPVIILTSSKEEMDMVDSYKLGANSYIRKPVNFSKFAKIVSEIGYYWILVNQSLK